MAKRAPGKPRNKKQPKPNDCSAASAARLERAANTPNERFSKGLDHDPTTGEVNASQFGFMISQLKKLNADPGNVAKNGFQLRANTNANLRKFVNPLAGWAVDTENTDPCCYEIANPPAVDSAEEAAEMIELYWMALLRDVPFIQWDDLSVVAAAADNLSSLPLFINHANPNGDPASSRFESIDISSKNIFRGGELARFAKPSGGLPEQVGPYVSQFLLHEIPYGTLRVPQRNISAVQKIDYMTEWGKWLDVQNGARRNDRQNLVGENDPGERRFLATMRDLATYVHFDALYEAYLNAAIILLGAGYPTNKGNPYGPGCSVMGIGQDQHPYHHDHFATSSGRSKPKYPDQDGFGTFGGPHILSLVTEVATRALKAVWRQKWTHFRLRPEAFGGLVHRALLGTGSAKFDGLSNDVERLIRGSTVFDRLVRRDGNHRWCCAENESALLPMAFPEGSPTHPSYGAGHATVAGACVTVLKAFFDGSVRFNNPVQASADGKFLIPYQGLDARSDNFTVELELNKLAANIAIGRNMGGVHWRSDYTQSMLLGQRVAIDMLYRQSATYAENYCFEFNSFGGKPVAIHPGKVQYDNKDLKLGQLARGEMPGILDCSIAQKLHDVI